MPVRYAIGACGSCLFSAVHYCFGHVGVNGWDDSVRGLILLCVLSISMFVGSCRSRDMEE